jgi:hypothetical protein
MRAHTKVTAALVDNGRVVVITDKGLTALALG